MRFRYVYMGIGSILVVLLLLTADPDSGIISNLSFGASTLASLLVMLNIILYTAALHLSRKALLDYLDLEEFFKRAYTTPEGAGRATQAIAIIMLAIAVVIYAATR